MDVFETDDGFEITWDPEDPVEAVLNDWTDEDFIKVIMEATNNVLTEHSFESDFMEK